MIKEHFCLNGERRSDDVYWVNDGYGIPLGMVCQQCEQTKLSQYRPDIMGRYDADEDLDED